MDDHDKKDHSEDRSTDRPPKTAGQDVGPPEERVDDEVGSDEAKTIKRQE